MIRRADPAPGDGPIQPGTPAPCRAACPVGTDAAAYVALLAEGRGAEAYDVARQPNPLASICGRVCAAPCERSCRRGVVDEPVAIRPIKRALTDAHGVEAGSGSRWRRALAAVPAATRPAVAIVGAGPAGLSAAHDLRLAGHPVALFEREDSVGGMLVHGIPRFRLPREVLEGEIAGILDLCAEVRTGCEVGRDVTIEQLLSGYAAVLVTVGCRQGRLLETPGVELGGVMRAVDFLRRANAAAPPVDGPVVVIGGGSVAFDAARSAWRLQGAQGGHGQTMLDAARAALRSSERIGGNGSRPSVTLVAPEAREELPVPPDELEQAEREGVVVRGRLGVRRVVGAGHAGGVEVAPVLALTDASGRFSPQLDEVRSEVIPARTIVLAIGQQADTAFLAGLAGLASTPGGGVATDAWGRTPDPRVFAAGDVASGPRDLIDAIASGQRAASAIAHALAGGDRTAAPRSRAIAPPPVPGAPPLRQVRRFWSGYDALARAELPVRPTRVRALATEVECSLDRDAAAREAERCLHCDEHLQLAAGRCLACGLCVDVCPNGCLALEAAGRGVALVFDDSTCIRCGLCVSRCPGDALALAAAPAPAPFPPGAAAGGAVPAGGASR